MAAFLFIIKKLSFIVVISIDRGNLKKPNRRLLRILEQQVPWTLLKTSVFYPLNVLKIHISKRLPPSFSLFS